MRSTSLYIDQIADSDLEVARRRFFVEGESVADWARQRGFSLQLTYSVLSGRVRARRGESHRIAVALGLKPEGGGATRMPAPTSLAVEGCAMK